MNVPEELIALFDAALAAQASDIHLVAGEMPRLRVRGELDPVTNAFRLEPVQLEEMLLSLFAPHTRSKFHTGVRTCAEVLLEHREFNFTLFAYRSTGGLAATVRIINAKIPTLAEIGGDCVTPFAKLTGLPRGLVLITGPHGSGKQTTSFAVVQKISSRSSRRVHLLEESLAYRLKSEKSLISQIIIGQDAPDYAPAMQSLYRGADPDVVYVADLPSSDAAQAALMLVRSGHLVIANANAASAADALAILCAALPDDSLALLAEHLVAVTNQRLMPKADGSGRIPAYEILRASSEIKSAILDRSDQATFARIMESGVDGMRTIPQVAAQHIPEGAVSKDAATALLRDYSTT